MKGFEYGSEGYDWEIDEALRMVQMYTRRRDAAIKNKSTKIIEECDRWIRGWNAHLEHLIKNNEKFKDIEHQRLRSEAVYCESRRGLVEGELDGFSFHASYEEL